MNLKLICLLGSLLYQVELHNSITTSDPYKCKMGEECPQPHRFCMITHCVCKNDYIENDVGECVKGSTSHLQRCWIKNGHSFGPIATESDYCAPEESCVNDKCMCRPDYKYDPHLVKCVKFECNQALDCTEYDPHRVCIDRNCSCEQNYQANGENGDFCVKTSVTHGKRCAAQSDCKEAHQRCVDKECICEPDYFWSNSTQECTSNHELECGGGCGRRNHNPDEYRDKFRECANVGNETNYQYKCACKHSYEEDPSNGNKCTLIPTIVPTVGSSTTATYHYSFLYYMIPISFIIGHHVTGGFLE